jgi:hypothetical protein
MSRSRHEQGKERAVAGNNKNKMRVGICNSRNE